MSNSADGRSVTSKLAAILQTFSTGNVHSLSDIARSANLPVSTAHRLTAELAEWGFLERTDDKRYRVGMLVTHLGTRVWHEPNLQEHARRILDDLSSATHATVRLGVLEDLAVSYIEKRPDTHPASTSFETRALPAHATAMGKALLAFAPQETVDAVIDNGLDQYTPFTIVAAPALRRALAIARMTRVATTRQELRLNTAAVAVPVVAGGGAVVAALELTTSGAGYQLHVIQSAVVVAARSLSRELTASSSAGRDRTGSRCSRDRRSSRCGRVRRPCRRRPAAPPTGARADRSHRRSRRRPSRSASLGTATCAGEIARSPGPPAGTVGPGGDMGPATRPSSRDSPRAAIMSAGTAVGISEETSHSRTSSAAATSPAGPKTGTATALWPGSSSPLATAIPRSRVTLSTWRSRAAVATVEAV